VPARTEPGLPDPPVANLPEPRAHAPHELIMHLEPDQLVAETFIPVPRAHLSVRARVALWGLRIFALVLSVMVIYVFVAQLQ